MTDTIDVVAADLRHRHSDRLQPDLRHTVRRQGPRVHRCGRQGMEREMSPAVTRRYRGGPHG